MIAWAANHTFYPFYFLLVLVGVVVNHVALNMADDYFDYKHSVDHLKPGEKNPYSGGSGTLSSGQIRPSAMFKAFTLCFSVTIIIGLFLTAVRGFPVLLFGLIGIFCAVFYTAPPISFSHHGLGELGLLINFGTIIGLGAYFVQTQSIGIEAFMATLPCGIMLFSMIVINEIPDYQEDRAAGKLTLVARFGKKSGVKLYAISWLCTYVVIAFGVFFRFMPVVTLLGLASLPLTLKSMLILKSNFENPEAMAPANLLMIAAHSLTSFSLIAAYSISGIISGADQFQLFIILSVLTISYFPALLAMRQTKKQITLKAS